MKKRILVRGPALSRSGYGEQTRFALRALKHHQDKFDIFLQATNWGATSWVTEDDEERQWIDNLLQKTIVHTQQNGTYDISLQVTIPGEWQKIAPVNIGYTAGIETTKISPNWLEKTYLMNRIVVPSTHAKEAFVTTSWKARTPSGEEIDVGCTTPIEPVSFPAKETEPEPLSIELPTKFNFLTVAQLSPRKNFDKTLKWFVEEFHDQEDVGLVAKVNLAKNCIIDRQATLMRLRIMLHEYPNRKCKVYLLHGALSEGEMLSLYSNPRIKALVSTSHGEGFGLPMLEAAQSGLPVVAPNWSGYLDFLSMPIKNKKTKKEKIKPRFLKVDYELKLVQKEAVWNDVIIPESMWCYPKEHSFKSALRKVYNEQNIVIAQAKKLQTHINKTLTNEAQYDKFISAMGLHFEPTTVEVDVFAPTEDTIQEHK